MHISFCSDKPILAGFSESFAPCPVSAFEGRHDGDVICLMQRIVNTPTPQCSPNVLCCESRQLSQKRDDFCMPFQRDASGSWQADRITSSAWNSSVGGMVRPRALAVLRLMTSSNFVGCS